MSIEELTVAIKFISRVSPIVPLSLYIYQKDIANRSINLIAILLVVAICSDSIIYFFGLVNKSNALVANIYFIAQFILIALIYNKIYLKRDKSRPMVLSALGLIFILTNAIFWQDIRQVQSLTWAVTSIIIASMAFGHFSYLIKYPVVYIKRFAPYWISTGLLFYCCLSFLLLGFSKFLADQLDAENFRVVWMFHNLNNIFKNGCFFMAIWWAARRNPQWDVADVHEN